MKFDAPDPDDLCDRCGWPVGVNYIRGETLIFCSETCKQNWEPPDPPGWEGGFADNH